MRTTILVLAFISLLFVVPGASAQALGPAQGLPMYGSSDGGGLARVNLQNLNVNAIFPIAGSSGRGVSAAFSLSYNSSIWTSGTGWLPVFNQSGAASWGWNKSFFVGHVDFRTVHAHCAGDPVGLNLGTTTYSNFSYIASDGTNHPFAISYHIPGECGGTSGGTLTGYATDGSGYYIDANQTLVRDPSGLTLTQYGQGLKDTNGNFYSSVTNITAGQTSTTWTDSRNKTAVWYLSPNPTNTLSDTYTYYDASGNPQTVSVQYQTLNIATHFACSGVIEYTGTATLPTTITLANSQHYTIAYEPTPTVSGSYTGRIQKITLPSGGFVQYTYGTANGGVNCSDGSTVNLTVVSSDGTTTTTTQYQRAQVAGVWQTTVTYPVMPYDTAANQIVVAFDANGHETSRKIYQGAVSGGTLLRTVNRSWATNGSPASQTVVLEDNTTAVLTETSYDSNGNLLSVKEHDWGTVATPGSIVRTTTLGYLATAPYTNLNILNRVATKTVADGGGAVHYRETTAYDQTALSPCPTGVTQHDDAAYGCSMLTRGNATSVTTYKDAATPSGPIAKNFKYDLFGNLVQADLNCCQAKTWTYSATTQYALPDSITRGSSSGTQLTTSATYNISNGSTATATDENGKITSYAYDAMGRVSTITRMTDNMAITYTYDDAHNAVSISAPIQGTSAARKKSTYDGLGRTIKTSTLDASNTSYSITENQYDPLGRSYKVSNPHNSTAQYWTETHFDALGRPTVIIPPGGSLTSDNTKYTYATNTVTATDPAGHARKQQMDGLGRAIKTFEPDISNGNVLTQETDMTYSTTDSLLQVTQGAQTRVYTYDDLGRLLTAKTPETNQVATTYVYNDFNLLTQRTDPRGVVTTYSYDSLNRPTGTSYNVGSTGVPTTSPVTLAYDLGGAAANALGRLTKLTDGPGSETYTYNNLGQLTQLQKIIAGTTYTISYAYNLAGEMTQITYPSGHVVQQSFDAIGRLCEVAPSTTGCATAASPYATNLGYNTAFQTTGLKYGNGVTASYSYSPDRLQLSSLSYAESNGLSLFQLNYSYATGNNGQIAGVANPSQPGQSVNYTYDALGRLSTALSVGWSGYAQWGLSFSYDRYGNRTDQNQTAGSPPANHVTVTPSTNRINTAGYAYDANGNMTNDGNNTLVYDAENRVTGATNGGSSGTYTYDGHGLRVKKVSGGASTVYLYSGSQVIAEYGSPSGIPTEHVLAGGQRLATLGGSVVPDGSFEQGLTYWTDGSPVQIVTDPTGAHSGNNYLQITTSTPGYTSHSRQLLPVSFGDTITFGGWAYRSSGTTGAVRWKLAALDSNQNSVTSPSPSPSDVSSATWTYQVGTYTVPANVAFVYLYAEIYQPTATTVARFDDGFLIASTRYYHSDQLSVRFTTDSTQYYSAHLGQYPFGEIWYDDGNTTTKGKFTAYERDTESGNDYALARSYVNRLGRFSSQDPIAGSTAAPQTQNGYSYVANDSISSTDPSGMLIIPGFGFVNFGGSSGSNFNEFDILELALKWEPIGGSWDHGFYQPNIGLLSLIFQPPMKDVFKNCVGKTPKDLDYTSPQKYKEGTMSAEQHITEGHIYPGTELTAYIFAPPMRSPQDGFATVKGYNAETFMNPDAVFQGTDPKNPTLNFLKQFPTEGANPYYPGVPAYIGATRGVTLPLSTNLLVLNADCIQVRTSFPIAP